MMTVDDIIEIIQDENKEDMLALAGVTESGLTDTALDTVKARAPWLFINLITAILASLVIAQFDYAIEQIAQYTLDQAGEDFVKVALRMGEIDGPRYDMSEFDAVLAELDALLPGEGSTADRVNAFRNKFAIPKDKLKPVFDTAIAECRIRTQKYFNLPETEKFRMEFVNDKSWSGYNYYQGNYESLIQINTDFPITIDRAVDLGCHEGYPGHHVWNLFIERELVGKRGWIEYSVNPLFGPFGPLAEGSGNFGILLAFPGDEKAKYETEVLYPIAGLDTAESETFNKVLELESKLSHATNDIARRYLDGELSKEEAVPLIQKYYLQSYEKSEQRLRFVDKYRGYVINYNIGQDIVRDYIAKAGSDPEAQWAAFRDMLTIPLTPSDMQ